MVAHVVRHIERHWRIVGARDVERRTVRKQPFGFADGDLAEGQQVAVELEFGEAPAMAGDGTAPGVYEVLYVPVVLLKMCRPQEHPLRPVHGQVVHGNQFS